MTLGGGSMKINEESMPEASKYMIIYNADEGGKGEVLYCRNEHHMNSIIEGFKSTGTIPLPPTSYWMCYYETPVSSIAPVIADKLIFKTQ